MLFKADQTVFLATRNNLSFSIELLRSFRREVESFPQFFSTQLHCFAIYLHPIPVHELIVGVLQSVSLFAPIFTISP